MMHQYQQVLLYICLTIAVNHVRGSNRHHHRIVISSNSNNNHDEVERFPFEFGRPSSQILFGETQRIGKVRLLQKVQQLDDLATKEFEDWRWLTDKCYIFNPPFFSMFLKYRTLQEVVEANAFFLSMSMSMSIPPSGRDAPLISLPRDTATPAPSSESTSPPSGIVAQTERLLPCTGSTNTAVSVTLQVELAIGKTHFEKDLETALTSALTRKERFSMCDPSRRLTEWKVNRQLEVDRIFLSPLIVTALQQACTVQGDSESSCRLATAEMAAFGTDDSQIILSTLDSIVKDDSSFHTELKTNGILDIRIVQEQQENTDRGSNVDAAISESSSTTTSSPSTIRSRQNVTAIVLSVTAVIVLVAVIIRRGARRRQRHLWYGPTMEEIYDENQCLGIQPRESFESPPSDMDSPSYYSPDRVFRTAASI